MSSTHLPPPRRLKILWITHDTLWRLLGAWGAGGGYLHPVIEDVPPDAVCEGVTYDPLRESFGLKLSHPSFPVHHPGEPIEWAAPLRLELQPPPLGPFSNARPGDYDAWRGITGEQVFQEALRAFADVPSMEALRQEAVDRVARQAAQRFLADDEAQRRAGPNPFFPPEP